MLGCNSLDLVFLRRLINVTTGIKHLDHFVHLTSEAEKDLWIWATFMSLFLKKTVGLLYMAGLLDGQSY